MPQMAIPSSRAFLRVIATLFGFISCIAADGNGFIGWGKHMYDPACAFACRGVIAKCTLLCTPKDPGLNHGTHHNPVATPPECFTTDNAFMRTMALCINTYCPKNGAPALSEIDDYWYSHLGTGSIGNYRSVPKVSYIEALLAAREDEASFGNSMGNNSTESSSTDHSEHQKLRARAEVNETGTADSQSVLPIIKAKMPLNVTSFIELKDWQLQYNGMTSFEINENGHSNYSITIMFVALFLPVLLSSLRFIPGLTRTRIWTYLNSVLTYPAVWGSKHRTPIGLLFGGGLVPTRGQALYITLLSILNIIFLVAPYIIIQPQSIFSSKAELVLSTIGNRAGVLALGNMVAMFVFSARNNILLSITDWSYGTFLLLHRWLGYWAIFHTALHSIMLLEYYKKYGSYADESKRLYWSWGIVGTVTAVAILPFSLLVVRQKAYEIFLLSHIILAALFLVGYYYHIWYLFEYKWGYEIWVFITVGIWATDRIWRLGRMASHGWKKARIMAVEGSNGEYLRIDIDGVHAQGVVYLCFPTLSWRFWETHPFSVASSFGASRRNPRITKAITVVGDAEKLSIELAPKLADTNSTSSISTFDTTLRATFIVRIRTSTTRLLAAKLASASSSKLCLPILIDGSYHSNAPSHLTDCTRVLCIAGGIGITAVLPYLHAFHAPRRARLFWGMRNRTLVDTLSSEIAALAPNIHVQTTVGKRLDVQNIVQEELVSHHGNGLVGIVVCGPAGLADDVRYHITELTRRGAIKSPYVFVDEAFSW